MNLSLDDLQILVKLTNQSAPITNGLYERLVKALADAEKGCHHYYSFTFQSVQEVKGNEVTTTHTGTYAFPEEKVSLAAIKKIKHELGARQESVILNISYLGCMTSEEAA